MTRGVHSTRVITGDSIRDATVVFEAEGIVDVVGGKPTGIDVEDLGDAVLMSGLVDSHVHVNEPGRTEWEGFDTATRAAAAGGITTIVDMPLNCTPVTTTRAALEEKLEACSFSLWVDCCFWGGVVPGNAPDLPQLLGAGVVGAKAFLCHSGIDDFPNATEADLREAMPLLAKSGVPLLVHAELQDDGVADGEAPETYGTYLASRPRQWEDRAIALMIELCRETQCRVHIVHLSSASALEMLREARSAGLPITAETCPHYLCLTAEDIPDRHTEFKCAPPIRDRGNCEALWEGLRQEIIDFVVSDHSPCVPQLKEPERGDFMSAWGGIASLQFGLSTVWTEARRRGFGPRDIWRWMSAGPARFVGLDTKGALERGRDADLVAWDPEATFVVQPSMIQHRHKITPYLGRTLHGVVRKTWLRGEPVFSEAGFSTRRGRPILRTP